MLMNFTATFARAGGASSQRRSLGSCHLLVGETRLLSPRHCDVVCKVC